MLDHLFRDWNKFRYFVNCSSVTPPLVGHRMPLYRYCWRCRFCLFCWSPKILSALTDPTFFLQPRSYPRFRRELASTIVINFSPWGETKFSNLQKKISQLANFALQVFPGLLQCLPLKEDFEENHPVYSCIMELFSDQHPLIRQYLPQLLAVFSQVLPSGSLQEGEWDCKNWGYPQMEQFSYDLEWAWARTTKNELEIIWLV